MQDELIDIYNKDGISTGEVCLKSEAHKMGLYHTSIHVWFFTKDHNILLQKRAVDKDTFPNLWDISVAGHIGSGETVENSAIREVKEEIGLSISKKDLIFIGTHLSEKKPKPDLLDNEFHHIFIAELKHSTQKLTLQEEEVSDIALIPISIFESEIRDSEKKKKYVPHDILYFEWILKEIKNQLR
ncbi:NUDIX hydrolase [Aquimarina pacifica]|uniref:NUDIX hydrolase n=1 Tax=Aquimarina pacifica TaxID=1296415 RepID=UPI000471C003|nr:NUDIX domain-containing protein [Aquimarina pacifica]